MTDDDGALPLSKSQRKRDALALHGLAEALTRLADAQLEGIPLSAEVREAVLQARRLERGAYRRQIRYLGRLLRAGDAAPIRSAVDACARATHEDKARFKRLERWRERLLEEGDTAVTALLDEYPGADAQQLRQLLRKARRERAEGRAPRHFRELMRFLRTL